MTVETTEKLASGLKQCCDSKRLANGCKEKKENVFYDDKALTDLKTRLSTIQLAYIPQSVTPPFQPNDCLLPFLT